MSAWLGYTLAAGNVMQKRYEANSSILLPIEPRGKSRLRGTRYADQLRRLALQAITLSPLRSMPWDISSLP